MIVYDINQERKTPQGQILYMKTGLAIMSSILIAAIIFISALIAYILFQGYQQLSSAPATPNPLTEAPFQTKDVTDENGASTGLRGYAEITKGELEAISAPQLKEFADQHVKNSPLQWVSIITPEGDGIYFPDSNYEYGEYGLLSPDGKISSLHGTITLINGAYQFQSAESVPAD